MSKRTPGEAEPTPGTRQARAPGLGSLFGASRNQAMGNRGLAAASIGWTLAGCIIAGFAAGAWIDKKFGTQIWTPVLFLAGVVAGFREIFRTVSQLSDAQKAEKQARSEACGLSPARSSPTDAAPSTRAKQAAIAAASRSEADGTAKQESVARPRLFSVPPPPFLEGASDEQATGPSVEEVKRRLAAGVADEESDAV